MAYFQGLTGGATEAQRKIILRRAVIVTMVVLWFFTFLGNLVLYLLRINVNYIMITGGIYILVYAVKSVIFDEEPKEIAGMQEKSGVPTGLPPRVVNRIAVVPLAIPLLAGPGAIATVMILNQPLAGGAYCFQGTVFAIAGNLCIWGPIATAAAVLVVSLSAWILFNLSNVIVKRFNPSLIYTLGKVMGILVGAIAISFIIQGVTAVFHLVL